MTLRLSLLTIRPRCSSPLTHQLISSVHPVERPRAAKRALQAAACALSVDSSLIKMAKCTTRVMLSRCKRSALSCPWMRPCAHHLINRCHGAILSLATLLHLRLVYGPGRREIGSRRMTTKKKTRPPTSVRQFTVEEVIASQRRQTAAQTRHSLRHPRRMLCHAQSTYGDRAQLERLSRHSPSNSCTGASLVRMKRPIRAWRCSRTPPRLCKTSDRSKRIASVACAMLHAVAPVPSLPQAKRGRACHRVDSSSWRMPLTTGVAASLVSWTSRERSAAEGAPTRQCPVSPA